jgi:glycosyltransferase involved in cell wall biosynthesis
MNEITFIIPTIGRETLINSINSLINQSIKEWNAIIIFDGIKNNININDKRIIIIEIDKIGPGINSAGEVRNYGMSLIKSKWYAFLDDDDTIENDYIETFYKELYINNDLDVLIFRMKMNDRIIPKIKTDNFYVCDVGISFIINCKIFENGIKFIPDPAEDYLYLNIIRKNEYKIIISPHIKYYVRETVRESNELNNILGNRVVIKKEINPELIILCNLLLNIKY